MSQPVLSSRRDGVLTVSFNRPEKLNAFDEAMTRATIEELDRAERDPSVHAIVLRGEGRGFCAGQDLEAFAQLDRDDIARSIAEHLRRGYNVLASKLRRIEKPAIASLNGIAAGVGLSLALACDLRIAGDDAQLTLGFSKIGLIPDGGGSFLLPLLIGLPRALELAWTSERIDAARALELGLVNRVVPAATLAQETQDYAARLAALSPVALAMTKRAFNKAVLPDFERWLDEEARLQGEAAAGPDLAEGIAAFLQKRKPAFSRT